jgi:hypothetical protein
LCSVATTFICLVSCGGGGSDSPSAEVLYQQTGKRAFVGDFKITNFSINPNPALTGDGLRLSFLATFTGSTAPARKSFDMTLFIEHGDYSSASVATQTFDLVSGTAAGGVYQAVGGATSVAPSSTGVVSYKIRLDPNAEGGVLPGTPGTAQVDVTTVAPP